MTITLTSIEGVQVGHVTDLTGLTGCTAVVFPQGAVAAHVAQGVASGSRELAAFSPRHLVERVHGICLSGGSAFGLAAASGVARALEAQGIGHPTSCGVVPIVAGAVVYDLNVGDAKARPDEADGAEAARQALAGTAAASGNVGAGTGVSAGKILGVGQATKTGLGQGGRVGQGGVAVAAVVVLNPVGDVLEPSTGRVLAGARVTPESTELAGAADIVRKGGGTSPLNDHQTTLAVIATDAKLSRVEATWLAEQGVAALARVLDPPFTRHDGDVVFTASVGDRPCELHHLGALARDALTEAVVDACLSASSAGGLPSCHGLTRAHE